MIKLTKGAILNGNLSHEEQQSIVSKIGQLGDAKMTSTSHGYCPGATSVTRPPDSFAS
jgi:hypothetical protein